MNDLEITRLCAEAMSWKTKIVSGVPVDTIFVLRQKPPKGEWNDYDPLRNDAQAMALVKKFELKLSKRQYLKTWRVSAFNESHTIVSLSSNADLNRAICECVAKMQNQRREQ